MDNRLFVILGSRLEDGTAQMRLVKCLSLPPRPPTENELHDIARRLRFDLQAGLVCFPAVGVIYGDTTGYGYQYEYG